MRGEGRRRGLVILATGSLLLAASDGGAEPRIISLGPDRGPAAGGTEVVVIVEGWTGLGQARVEFDGRPARVVASEGRTLRVIAPPGRPGPVPVRVIPALIGGASPPAIFIYIAGAAILRLAPASALAGSDRVLLAAEGRGFTLATGLRFGDRELPTTFVGPDRLQAWIPRELLADAREVPVTAVDPRSPAGPGAPGEAATFVVANPAPSLEAIAGVAARAGVPGVPIQIFGRGFVPGSRVLFGGTRVPTTYLGPQELHAAVPGALLGAPGSVSVTVENPPPGGGRSGASPFAILPATPGRFVVFTSNRAGGRNHIYLYDREAAALDPLAEANSIGGSDSHPSISADGRFIVFQSDRRGGRTHVFLFDRGTRTLDPLPELNGPSGFDGSPRISPDGRLIVFESDRKGGQFDLYLFDRETRALMELAPANDPRADDGLAGLSD